MTCKIVRNLLSDTHKSGAAARAMYVCNCNGLRERDVRAAIAAGASRPAQIFKACDSAAQCARCVCDMRKMLDEDREALRFAAE
jgi:bacterioferritin-associated ferredoxin